MPKPKEIKNEASQEKNLKVKCLECDNINAIPIARFYDGFDGSFICTKCTYELDLANHIADE